MFTFGLYIPFHNLPVIKVQIVLPRLLSIRMAWWECSVFLKALIFEVIVILCLRGAAQVLLFSFHFPDMFRVSGKLPPVPLMAVCLALLHGRHSRSGSRCCLRFWVKSVDLEQLHGLLSDWMSSYSFLIFGLKAAPFISLPLWNEKSVAQHELKRTTQQRKTKSWKQLLLFLIFYSKFFPEV